MYIYIFIYRYIYIYIYRCGYLLSMNCVSSHFASFNVSKVLKIMVCWDPNGTYALLSPPTLLIAHICSIAFLLPLLFKLSASIRSNPYGKTFPKISCRKLPHLCNWSSALIRGSRCARREKMDRWSYAWTPVVVWDAKAPSLSRWFLGQIPTGPALKMWVSLAFEGFGTPQKALNGFDGSEIRGDQPPDM